MKQVTYIEIKVVDNHSHILYWFKNDMIHRVNDKPAVISYYNGKVRGKHWFIKDEYDREHNKPVMLYYEPGTNEIMVEYFKYNTYKPTKISYPDNQTEWHMRFAGNVINKTKEVKQWLNEHGLSRSCTEIPDEYKAEFRLTFY